MAIRCLSTSESGTVALPLPLLDLEHEGGLTLELWLRLEGVHPSEGLKDVMWSQTLTATSSAVSSFALGVNGEGRPVLTINHEQGCIESQVVASRSDGKGFYDQAWHHIAIAMRHDGIRLYVDAELVGIMNQVPKVVFAGQLIIGYRSSGQSFASAISVTELRVWNTFLDQQVIASRKDQRSTEPASPQMGYWPLHQAGNNRVRPLLASLAQPMQGLGLAGGAVLSGTTAWHDDEPLPPPPHPIVTASTDLGEDYRQGASGEFQEGSSFETVIKVTDADSRPYQGSLVVRSTAPTKVEVHGTTYSIDTVQGIEVATDVQGEVVLTTVAEDSLAVPLLLVTPDFASSEQQMLVERNAAVRERMANLTPEKLQDLLEPTEHREEEAQQLVQVFQTILHKPSVDHQVISPPRALATRSAGPKLSTSSVQAAFNATTQAVPLILQPAELLQGSPLAYEIRNPVQRSQRSFQKQALRPKHNFQEAHNLQEAHSLQEEQYFQISFSSDGRRNILVHEDTHDTFTTYQARLAAQPDAKDKTTGRGFRAGRLRQRIKNLVLKVITKVVDTVVAGVKAVVRKVIAIVEDIGAKLKEIIVETVEQALDLVRTIFERLSIAASRVVKFLRSLFPWDDIKRTKHFIRCTVEQAIDRTIRDVDELRAKAQIMTDTLKSKIIASFDEASSVVAAESGRVDRHDLPRTSHTSWFQNKLTTNLQAPNVQVTQPTINPTETSELEQLFQRLADAVTDPDVLAALDHTWIHCQHVLTNPGQAIPHLIQGLFQGLKGLVVVSVNLVGVLLDTLLLLVQKGLGLLKTFLNTPIYIPVISELYLRFVSEDGLTPLDIVSLAVAFPVTILYKLLYNQQAPFSEQDNIQKLVTHTMQPTTAAQPTARTLSALKTGPGRQERAERAFLITQLVLVPLAAHYARMSTLVSIVDEVGVPLPFISAGLTLISVALETAINAFNIPILEGYVDSNVLLQIKFVCGFLPPLFSFVGSVPSVLANLPSLRDIMPTQLNRVYPTGTAPSGGGFLECVRKIGSSIEDLCSASIIILSTCVHGMILAIDIVLIVMWTLQKREDQEAEAHGDRDTKLLFASNIIGSVAGVAGFLHLPLVGLREVKEATAIAVMLSISKVGSFIELICALAVEGLLGGVLGLSQKDQKTQKTPLNPGLFSF